MIWKNLVPVQKKLQTTYISSGKKTGGYEKFVKRIYTCQQQEIIIITNNKVWKKKFLQDNVLTTVKNICCRQLLLQKLLKGKGKKGKIQILMEIAGLPILFITV